MNSPEMTICLWYDTQAEEAANFYTSVFKDSEIGRIARFGKEGFEFHGMPEGSVLTVEFRLNKMKFIAVNGGPMFKFNEAASVVVYCDTQDEIDYYWNKLSEAGAESQCGWLKDKFGLSWQITPTKLPAYLADPDSEKRSRASAAMFTMKKFDIAKIDAAYKGE